MKMELFIADADGKNQKQITNYGCASFAPTFTPDGKKILFSSNKHKCDSRDFELYLINLDGSGPGTGDHLRRLHFVPRIFARRQEAGLRGGLQGDRKIRIQHLYGGLEMMKHIAALLTIAGSCGRANPQSGSREKRLLAIGPVLGYPARRDHGWSGDHLEDRQGHGPVGHLHSHGHAVDHQEEARKQREESGLFRRDAVLHHRRIATGR